MGETGRTILATQLTAIVPIGSENFPDREFQSMGPQAYYTLSCALPKPAHFRQNSPAHVVGTTSPRHTVSPPMPNSAGPERMLVHKSGKARKYAKYQSGRDSCIASLGYAIAATGGIHPHGTFYRPRIS